MAQLRYIRFDPKSIGPLGWVIAAVLATLMLAAIAFIGAVALAIGIGLLVIGGILRQLRRWWPGRPTAPAAGRQQEGEVIEAEYRVIREVRPPSADDDRRGDAP